LDRFGLAPVLLLGLAWIGHREVVVPIAKAYAKMVADVDENNKLLKESVERNNQEDSVRVQSISAAQALNKSLAEENKALNTKILEAISNADAARRQIHAETRVLLERVERLIQKGGTDETAK
jgi:formiminotetrahydrofolate cyclodeaminase